MARVTVPTYDAMMAPLVQALRDLGGSGTIEEIETNIAQMLRLSDDEILSRLLALNLQGAKASGESLAAAAEEGAEDRE